MRSHHDHFATGLRGLAAVAVLWLAVLTGTAHAGSPTPAPLHTDLTLTHVAGATWRADYVFAEPVTAVELGDQVGTYRKQGWRLLTAGVVLVGKDEKEALRSAAPLKRLSVEITANDDFAEGQYAPAVRFSDGGWNLYLGFLHGELVQGKRERAMDVALHLRGLPGETVVAPTRPGADLAGYAYFGPQRPVRLGIADVVVDPLAAPWLREVIDDTVAKVSSFYEQALQRKLLDTPLISVAVVGLEGAPGSFSIKGGVAGGNIAFRLQGAGLVADHPKKRAMVASLVAHEVAHLWQMNLKQGGVGEQAAWIHEGGAEALMLAALRATGIYTEAAADQYAQKLLAECEQLNGDVESYRGHYACGFKRFNGYGVAPVPLWRALMNRSEVSGEVYSEAMIRAVLR